MLSDSDEEMVEQKFGHNRINNLNVHLAQYRPQDAQLDARILVVDDDKFLMDSLQRILRSYGFASDQAHNGQEAIDKVH